MLFRYMDSGMHRHGHSKEKQETMSHEEWINTAFFNCNCSSVESSLPKSPPLHCSDYSLFSLTHRCLYIYLHYNFRSVLNRYGSLLSAVVMGLNIPLQGSRFGLSIPIRQANHCHKYFRLHLIICMQFAWFGCGERSTNLREFLFTRKFES